MLRNILGLRERRIADVMVPRADIIAVKRDISLGELIDVFESAAHSRLVVYNDTLDDPEGIVHIRDLVAYIDGAREGRSGGQRQAQEAVSGRPRSARGGSQHPNRRRQHHPQAAVCAAVDAGARPAGQDGRPAAFTWRWWWTNMAAPTGWCRSRTSSSRSSARSTTSTTAMNRRPWCARRTNSFIADARASLEDVKSVIGDSFVIGEAGEDVDTLGGYLVAQVGRLPVRGEIISGPGDFEIEVLDADPRRVKRLRIGTREDRSALRHRETRRREAAADAAARNPDNSAPPPDGAPSS